MHLDAHRYMEELEVQAREIEFGGTYPGPKLRTFPSKVTWGLHPTPPMETYDGPAWRLMSTLLFSWGRVRGVVRVRVRVRVYACVCVCVCVCVFVCVCVCCVFM